MKKSTLLIPLLSILLVGCQVVNSLQPVETAAAQGTILFQDDFSNNDHHWGISTNDKGNIGLLYEGLDFKVNKTDTMIWSVAGDKYQDTQIDVDAVLLNGISDDAFGAICRYQDDKNYYGFLVTNDGYYGIFKMEKGNFVLAQSEQGLKYSEAIRQGGVVNHIQVVCKGDLLQLSVNDTLLSIVQDESFMNGKIGLIAGAYATPGVEIFFDNLKVTQP